MKKTTLYLDPAVDQAFARIASAAGITKAEAIRQALARTAAAIERPRITAIGLGVGPGDVADETDRHLAETGFGAE